MAALLEKEINPQLRRRDVSNTFTVTRAEETPFVSMVKKGPRPKATLYEWLIKVRHTPTDNAVADGVDVADGDVVNNEANKKPMQGRVQKGRVAFGVSDMAEELGEEYGVAGGLLADNRADALVLAKENMEVTCIKTGDSQAHIDNSNPMKLRGLCSFIRTANPPDPDLPIPSIGLVPAGNILSGKASAAAVTEEELLDVLQSIATAARQMKTVHVFATPAMRRQISSWLKFTPESAGNVLVRRFNNEVEKGKATEITLTVDRITCDFGKFFLHTHFSLPSGVHCIIADMDMVMLRQVRTPKLTKLEYRGGKNVEFFEYITGLEVSNPRCHGKITT
jgi:hypothetical protein